MTVIVDAIRARSPEALVVAVSMAPADTERRHGVPALPINPVPTATTSPSAAGSAGVSAGPRGALRAVARRVPGRRLYRFVRTVRRAGLEPPFIVRSYRRLREIDAIVVAGSGQLLDAWRGPWEHPLTTFRWGLLARLARTPMLYPSVGAGPIDGGLSAFLIRKAVAWAAFVSVRDEDSARVLRAIGVRRDLPVCPDMGWAHDLSDVLARDAASEPPVVGVNVMSHHDPRYWPRAEPGRYEAYLEKMADAVAHLLRERYAVLLFSSQTRSDRLVVEDLRRSLAERGLDDHPLLSSAVEEIETIGDLVRTVARCDYAIAARFHSVLLPLALGIPTLGIAYHPKTCELLDQIGRPSRCVDIDRFEVPDLVAAFARLREEDTAVERAALRERAGQLRAEVEAQFDELLGPRPVTPGSRSGGARP